MDGDQLGRLIYLVLLGAAVGGYFFVGNRRNLGKSAQQAAIWALIFVGFIVGYGLWGDLQSTISPQQSVLGDEGRITVPRDRDGHYYLTLDINGTPVKFVVDTGASNVVLTRQDARRVGIELDNLIFSGRAETANGVVRTAPIRVETIALGPIVERRMRIWVNGGEMEGSLLGMGYLDRFSRVEIAAGKLVLIR